MTRSPSVRLAADIGGTFTDIVLETDAGRYTTKVLTTSEAPERGAIAGIDKALNIAGISPTEVDVLIHGTTLATNALIERKGAKTAFLTTEGFRDILEMGFEKRFEHYDVFMDKPTPLVPRPLRRPVRERVSGRGQVLLPLDTDQVREIGRELKEVDVEAIAVGLIHSYAFSGHERVIREILSEELPGVTICLSSDVCPEIREYERFSTTCANAYVRPLMSGYLLRFQDMLNERGMVCPWVFHRNGRPMRSFYGAWRTACRAAGYPQRILHDFRRTAVRNLVRAGVPENVAMKLTGHKTRSVFDRYDIVNEADLRDAVRKLAAAHDDARPTGRVTAMVRGR